jgi:hypothetical protein
MVIILNLSGVTVILHVSSIGLPAPKCESHSADTRRVALWTEIARVPLQTREIGPWWGKVCCFFYLMQHILFAARPYAAPPLLKQIGRP